jgi:galactokinase
MEIHSEFRHHFNRTPGFSLRAPGRVNLLGEHVDYNEGFVLPAAIDRAVHLAFSPTEDHSVTLVALDLNESVSFDPEKLDEKRDVNGKPLPTWALYPAGVAWVLGNAGYRLTGMQAVYSSNIPIGAGLSSSAAVEVGFALAWQTLGGWEADRLLLAQLCQKAENQFVGVACGLMDQYASANGVKGHALYLDIRSLECQLAPLPEETAIVIADSGIRRSLANSEYNQRRAACEQAVTLLQQHLPQIRSLRDVSPTEFAAYSVYLPPTVRKRAEHVVKEIARVESAFNALLRQDKSAFGALMYAGHASLRDLYEVSLPDLDRLVALTRELPGCLGARLTGAGFGGCTVNLVEKENTPDFIRGLKENYHAATGKQIQVYYCEAVDGASLESFI